MHIQWFKSSCSDSLLTRSLLLWQNSWENPSKEKLILAEGIRDFSPRLSDSDSCRFLAVVNRGNSGKVCWNKWWWSRREERAGTLSKGKPQRSAFFNGGHHLPASIWFVNCWVNPSVRSQSSYSVQLWKPTCAQEAKPSAPEHTKDSDNPLDSLLCGPLLSIKYHTYHTTISNPVWCHLSFSRCACSLEPEKLDLSSLRGWGGKLSWET